MAAITCPHNCGITFDKDSSLVKNQNLVREVTHRWDLRGWRCPSCRGLVLEIQRLTENLTDDGTAAPAGTVLEQHRIWPLSSRQPAAEVPADIASDFAEAASVLDLSPRASAAISRRCLQHTLQHLNVSGRDLVKQIDSIKGQLPAHIEDALHALRSIGNFAAHPIKDQLTGAIVDVAPGEAEWMLDVLEQLFDHAYVGPALTQARKAALNQKLQAAGKPTVP
jgi:hypothetical protein